MTTYAEYREQFTRAGQGAMTEVPTHLDLELASVCNFRCPMCPQAESQVDWVKGFMPTDLALRMLDEAKRLGILSVKLNWRGESTLHPQFDEITRYARMLKFTDLMLNTNGAYTDKIGDTIDACVDTLIYSIDSLNHARAAVLRPPGKLSDVLKNLGRSYAQRRLNGFPKILRINFTRQKENWDELEAFQNFCKEFGLELYAKNVFPRNPPKAGEYFPDEKFKVIGRKNCGFPFQRLVVSHDGRVAPCCVPWNDTLFVGDVNKNTLLEIWNDAPLRAIRAAALAAEYKHPTCADCTSWASYNVEVTK